MKLTRRRLLILGGTGASVGAVQALADDSDDGESIHGGTMALSEAYQVAEGVWVGPDSAKSNVAADAGNLYLASDTQVDYHGDGGAWVKMGVGSSSESVPAVHTEKAEIGVKPSDGLQGLKDAEAALPASGGVIRMRDGTYEATGTYSDGYLWDITKPILLKGEGESSEIRLADGTTATDEGARIVRVSANGVRFQNFTINGNYQNNNTSDANDGANIYVDANDFYITNVTSKNSTGDGITGGGRRITITNCHFIENWEQSFHPGSMKDFVFANNVCEREINNAHIHLRSGNGLVTERGLIANNTIRDGQQQAIVVTSGPGTTRNIRIVNNIIENPGKQGVLFDNPMSDEAAHQIQIEGNTIKQAGSNALELVGHEDIRICGNEIIEPQQHGILFTPAGNTVGLTIRNNMVKDPNVAAGGYDAYHFANGDSNVFGLTFAGNEYHTSGAGTAERAIYVDGSGTGSYNRTIFRDNDRLDKTNSTPRIEINKSIPQISDSVAPYETTGVATLSGDGSAQQFQLTDDHGVTGLSRFRGTHPSNRSGMDVHVTPASQAAIDASPCVGIPTNPDGDGMWEGADVKFTSAPASGTDNVVVRWTVKFQDYQ